MKKVFIFTILLIIISLLPHKSVNAYGGCEQYGPMAYEVGNSCQCISGYSFGKDFMGQTSCVSDTQLCQNKYGYNATSDFSGSCKCNYGYGFSKDSLGQTQCISLNSVCYDQLGYSSSYDSLSDSCKCNYGYIINGGQCVNGDSFCRTKNGLYSSYSTTNNRCD